MSGSTIGGIAGAAIGYWAGGSRGAQVGWMIGSAVGGYVDPDVIKGQRLTDAQQQTSMEGAPRAIIFGTAVVAGNVIQSGPLVEHKSKDRTGKGGPVQESFSYTRSYAIRVCEGPIGNISRIWRNDKLVLDWRNPADWPDAAAAINAMAGDSAKFASKITIYRGDENQLPDPTLEALPVANGGGIGNVNAYRGSCYVVFTDDDLTDMQGAIPQYRFEVSCCGDTTSTQATIGWVHGDTGNTQSIFSGAINGLTAVVGGWNDNLRRSTDGGVSWNAVPYTDILSWSPAAPIIAIWHVVDPQYTSGVWYMALTDSVAVSYDDGATFTHYIDPVHDLAGQVYFAGGAYYAGAASQTNTTIFQPSSLGDTDIDLGADYGEVSCIGGLGGTLVVGTESGYIVNGGGSVLYSGATAIRQFAANADASICVAALDAGGWLRSIDAGNTWTLISGTSLGGVIYARGSFYFSDTGHVYSSSDALTLTEVDDSFIGAGGQSFLFTDGASVLATASAQQTAILPSAYVLPDFASGWHIDNVGNVVGDVVTSVDRCVADLDATVLDLCARAGVDSSQVDVSQLAGIPLRGFTVGQPMPASDAIRTLQQGYFFDFPEWGDWPDTSTKLRAIVRGGDSILDITNDDLVESDDDADTRAQAVEFPRKLNLMTSDVDADYNPTKQTAERRTENIKAVGESTLQLAISTIRTEAAPMADKMLKVAWEEALGSIQFELPEEYTQLVPSDCFTKDSKRWRATKCEYGDGSVKVEAVRDRVSAYTSVATPGSIPPPTVTPSTLRGPTAFAAMNLPSLRSADNVPGMYVAVCGLLDGWGGCDLYLSTDGGLTEQFVERITTETTMGTLSAPCAADATSFTATLLHDHEIDSVTDAQIAARANAFAIVTNGTAEIGQAKTAEETDGVYTLSDLSRPLLQTTAAAHNAGDQLVMLDTVTFIPLDVALAGKTLIFRPVSIGTAPANNRTYAVVFSPLFTSATPVDFRITEAGQTRLTEDGTFRQAE